MGGRRGAGSEKETGSARAGLLEDAVVADIFTPKVPRLSAFVLTLNIFKCDLFRAKKRQV